MYIHIEAHCKSYHRMRDREPERKVTDIFAEQALLPDGWHNNVRITLAKGRIATVEPESTALAGDERHCYSAARHAQSAQPRLPARHGRIGRASRPLRRQFLELARGDVSFRAVDDARSGRGSCRAALCRDAGGGLFTRRRISLSASRPRRKTLRQPRRDGRAHRGRGQRNRYRPDAAAGVLRALLFWRRGPQ